MNSADSGIPKSVTNIGNSVFLGSENLKNIYYSGTEEEWNKIKIGFNNEALLNAEIHFASEPPVSEVIPGDTNNDGIINTKDMIFLSRAVAGGWDVKLNETSADVNKDGKVNMADVILLRRYLAGGWNVELK